MCQSQKHSLLNFTLFSDWSVWLPSHIFNCHCTCLKEIGTANVLFRICEITHFSCSMCCFDVGIVIWKTKHLTFTRETTHIFLKCSLPPNETTKHGIGHLATSIKTGRKMLPGQSASFELIEAGPAPSCSFFEDPDWKGSVLPKRRCINSCTITHKRTSLVSTKVFVVRALDGDASMFQELKEKVLWLFSIWAH